MIKSHEMQHVPGSWTESNGIFLPKPGKTDNNKSNSYRTITLSPTLLKLQEKVILWHMQHDLGMEDILSKKQFGFKKGTSTMTAFHKVIHKIEKRIAKKVYVLGTFLDIERAFDNVSFEAISEAIGMMINHYTLAYHVTKFSTFLRWLWRKNQNPNTLL